MRSKRPQNPEWGHRFASLLLLSILLALPGGLRAQTTILYLKNGDRLTGTILAEDTNRVVLATTWVKELTVPLAQVQRREKVLAETTAPGSAASNAIPALAAQPAPSATATNKNGTPVPNPNAPVAVTTVPTPSSPAAPPRHWKAELHLGADFLRGAKDQDTYYGRAKLTYERPYASNPKEFFRSVLDYTLDYGRTEGVLSANRMYASDKTDLDIGKRWYLYNLAGVGYDEIRKIDIGFEVGPGVGYHLITASNLVMNLEAGLDYQAQYRSDGDNTKTYYPRLAEDLTWKLQKRVTLTEKSEYFPPVDSGGFRFRFEATLSFGLWEHLSLNLTALDLYDSEPAADVPQNDAQLRSSIGVTF